MREPLVIPDAAMALTRRADLAVLTAKARRRWDRWQRTGDPAAMAEYDAIRAQMRPIEDALTAWDREHGGK